MATVLFTMYQVDKHKSVCQISGVRCTKVTYRILFKALFSKWIDIHKHIYSICCALFSKIYLDLLYLYCKARNAKVCSCLNPLPKLAHQTRLWSKVWLYDIGTSLLNFKHCVLFQKLNLQAFVLLVAYSRYRPCNVEGRNIIARVTRWVE